MIKLIEFIAKHIVDKPDEILIQEEENESGTLIKLKVHPEDMGKIIGRNGRVIKAIRNLLRMKAVKTGKRAYLEVVEQS